MRVVYKLRRTLLLLAALAVAVLLVSGIALALNEITCPNRDDNAFGHLCVGTGEGDLMVGTAQADDMRGRDGNDTIRAKEDNDRLLGAGGNDRLQGQAGDDRYVFGGGWGDDIIPAESSGRDTVRFPDLSARVRIALDEQHPSIPRGATSGQNSLTFADNFIEGAVGGSGNDLIAGSSASNWLKGKEGDDTLEGGDGDDLYRRVSGHDVIDDASGSADRLNLADHSSSNATFAPIDSPDADANYDALSIDVGGGNSVIIKGYFDNSAEKVLASRAGAGLIENIRFSDKSLDFGEIQSLMVEASADSATTDEDTAIVIDVLANDTGPNLSVSSPVGDPAHGTAELNNEGKVLYTPEKDFHGTDTFTYQACDNLTPPRCDEATVSVTVNPLNDAPVANNDSATVEEGATVSGNVLTNDTDVDSGDALQAVFVSGPTNASSFELNTDGSFSYTHDGTETTSDTFTYKTSDGTADSEVATVTITINPVDDPPVAEDDSATVDEDSGATTIDVLANDTDGGDGGPVTIESVEQPDNGSVDITNNGADLTYEPDPNYCNGGSPTDDFTYTLGGGSTATVSVTVTCVNDAPVASADSYDMNEDETFSIAAPGVLGNDTDVEGDPLTASLVSGPAHAQSFTLHPDGSFDYAPNADFNGPDTFTYKASDGSALSNETTVTITVRPVNDAPSFDLGADQTVVNTAGAQTVSDFATNISAGPPDESGQELTFTVTNDNNSLFSVQPDIDEESGDLTYTPDPSATGTATVSVTLMDDGGTANGGQDTSATKTFQITVEPPNAPPIVEDQSVSTDEDTAKTITLAAEDPDGDAVTSFSISDGPDHGSLGPIGSIDCDGQTPNHCTADVSYTGNKDYNGPDQFQFTASDAQATSSAATVDITVNAVDDPPVTVNDSATVNEDSGATTIDVLANDTDVDGGPKTITAVTQPTNGTVVITGGGTGLTYAPNANYCNDGAPPNDTFTYTLNGGSTATVSVTVTCVDDDPVAVNDSATKAEDSGASAIDVLANDTDVDGGPKSINSVTQPTNGTVVITGGGTGLTYEPDPNYCNDPPGTNPDTFSYTLSPGGSSATVSVKVSCVDDPPFAVNDSATVLEDAAATNVPVLDNDTDIDGGPKTISSASDPTNGTVVLTGGSPGARTGLTYQPDPNYCNDPPATNLDTFTYTLNGGSQATVSMKVTCVNDNPVADDETFNGNSGAVGNTALVVNDPSDGAPSVSGPKKSITGDILDGDTDVDGPNQLAVQAGTFTTNDGGSVTIEADGDFTYVSDPADACADASDFFDYTVTDGNSPTAGTDTGRVTVSISGCVWYVSNNATGNSGTSTAPFDTLAQAQSASASGHSIFLFDGANTSTGYNAGIDLKANQKLIGEAANLVVGSDTLHTGDATKRPTITDSDADVVALDDANEVRGLEIDPQGTGGGIAGATGDTGGGTIDDVRIIDTGTLGTQPGLELDSTTGTFDVSNLVVNNFATGVRLHNTTTPANAVNAVFAPTGQISIQSNGSPGLSANGTSAVPVNLGTSTFDDITVSGSGNGGVSLSNVSGTTNLGDGTGTDLNLTTTTGASPAFNLSNAGTITVGSAGVDNVSANGGPAIDVTGTSGASLEFDDVDSTGSANDGINLAGLGSGTFTATSGDIGGAAGIAFDLDGGSGAISYPGALNNGAGATAEITGRSGGAVTLSGQIADTNDAGGGISMSSNTGGSTTFSASSKVLNTGASAAFSSTGSGHTINFTNGGLDIDTTSGGGFSATGGGTVTVQTGTNANTIDTTTGTALNVSNTTIGSNGLTFRNISANGATNGIVLNNTGATAGLTVTGGGNTSVGGDDSGGIIQNTTNYGISLTNTTSPSFRNMNIHDTGRNGIDGTGVVNFTFVNSKITTTGNSGPDQYEQNSMAFVESAANPTTNTLSGTVTITQNTISDPRRNAIMIETWNGTISNLNISTNNITGGTTNGDILDAIHVFTQGSATTASNITTGTIQNNTISGFRFLSGSIYIGGNGIRVAGGTGNGTNTTPTTLGTLANPILISGNDVDDMGSNAIAVSFNGEQGTSNFTIRDNGTLADPMSNMEGLGISVFSGGTGNFTALVHNNVIDTNGPTVHAGSSGIGVQMDAPPSGSTAANPQVKYTVSNNTIKKPDGNGIIAIGLNNSGTMNLQMTGNTVTDVPFLTARYGIRVAQNNATSGTICLGMSGNATAGGSGITGKGIGIRRNAPLVFGVVGLPAGSTASPQFEAYIDGQNPLGNGSELISATSGFSSCTLPTGMPTP